MSITPKPRRWRIGAVVAALAIGTTALTPLGRAAEGFFAPLERPITQIGGFDTANPLPEAALALTFGTTQTVSGGGGGTGNQIYFLGGEYGVTDRLSFGLWAESYEDPPITPINGLTPDIGLDTIAAFGKYHLHDGEQLDISAKASVEFLRISTDIWGTATGTNAENIVGSLQVPVSYRLNNGLTLHATPGVSIFPETLNGIDFYGVVPFLGAGASYRFSPRFVAYGSVTVPFGPGGNTVTTTGTIDRVPIWTAGGRFNVTPKGALDLYVTNGIGTTPATRILSHFPEGDDVLVGARFTWTPGNGLNYRDSYQPLRALTPREISLQQDGFTLASVDTRAPGTVAARGWYGTGDNYGLGLVLAPDQHGQFEFYAESYADDGSVPPALLPSNTDERYMVGGKLRFLDQNLGDPFSFSARVLGGRDLDTNAPGNGVLYLEGIAGYKLGERLSLTAAAKGAAFGNNEFYGLGLGVNYELFQGLEVIGEVTPTEGANGTVWAAGVRYNLNDYGLSVDAHATNAIGYAGLGSLIAQDDTKFSVSLTKSLNLSNWR